MNTDDPALTFNLIDEPWIPVDTADGVALWSIREALTRPSTASRITGELATEVLAVHRLLLAILYRALDVSERAWRQCWRSRTLPAAEIEQYLDAYHPRFDLLHPERPFYQVADLRTTKGEFTELERLIADAPTRHAFMTTRLKESLQSLSFAEAARWLIHCQAFDPSGIKSGAVGDDRVKGGRGYPIGPGSAGQIGGLLWEGSTLLETLLLNLPPAKEDQQAADSAVWGRDDPDTAATRYPLANSADLPAQPRGPAANLTWQSRRIRLNHDGARVTGVLICNGDRYSPLNLGHVEHMTAWRDSPTQAKRYGLGSARMPRLHDPNRSLWRGLGSLLVSVGNPSGAPASVEHLSGQVLDGVLDSGNLYRVRAIGAEYVSNASVIGEIIDDALTLPMRSLTDGDEGVASTVVALVNRTEEAVRAFGQLAQNLARAAGGGQEADARSSALARARAFSDLDQPFTRWLLSLADTSLRVDDASQQWGATVRRILLNLSEDAVAAAGPAAWTGRDVNGRYVNSARAEAWFRRDLYARFPSNQPEEAS